MSNEVSNCHHAALEVVGGAEGTNHYECLECGEACDGMTTKPTELDTQELRKVLSDFAVSVIAGAHGVEDQMTLDDAVALIAQREQAAELRGRIDEFENIWDIVYEIYDVGDVHRAMEKLKDRLAFLQATKPEKGTS